MSYDVDPKVHTIIIDMHDVPSMDGAAIVALQSLIDEVHHESVALILAGLPTRIIVQLHRAGIGKTVGMLTYCRGLPRARSVALHWQKEKTE
ncbi:hypothetical protein HCU01_09960 [Halomonas cupida]|uniref:STAS domain-containing protein n=1 Tax=Halomonas cupida TaxID=44933 RepID=A0A1M7DNN0_9GAMM|nr:sodium-independent anion transporter [Halomonas cupida]GEN23047.1 hypothetical protein HCU01_09960 [Halomonas cupida]SHL81082.1 STAS domain-containing protein [Halomonas cupida]